MDSDLKTILKELCATLKSVLLFGVLVVVLALAVEIWLALPQFAAQSVSVSLLIAAIISTACWLLRLSKVADEECKRRIALEGVFISLFSAVIFFVSLLIRSYPSIFRLC